MILLEMAHHYSKFKKRFQFEITHVIKGILCIGMKIYRKIVEMIR